ncbi:hypothetical protein BC835DRAFT_1310172 [Cytidiella melzeri]|nr:hypothetical protein BC835DRAFT_1310172 [Cytidiella melzeri]
MTPTAVTTQSLVLVRKAANCSEPLNRSTYLHPPAAFSLVRCLGVLSARTPAMIARAGRVSKGATQLVYDYLPPTIVTSTSEKSHTNVSTDKISANVYSNIVLGFLNAAVTSQPLCREEVPISDQQIDKKVFLVDLNAAMSSQSIQISWNQRTETPLGNINLTPLDSKQKGAAINQSINLRDEDLTKLMTPKLSVTWPLHSMNLKPTLCSSLRRMASIWTMTRPSTAPTRPIGTCSYCRTYRWVQGLARRRYKLKTVPAAGINQLEGLSSRGAFTYPRLVALSNLYSPTPSTLFQSRTTSANRQELMSCSPSATRTRELNVGSRNHPKLLSRQLPKPHCLPRPTEAQPIELGLSESYKMVYTVTGPSARGTGVAHPTWEHVADTKQSGVMDVLYSDCTVSFREHVSESWREAVLTIARTGHGLSNQDERSVHGDRPRARHVR